MSTKTQTVYTSAGGEKLIGVSFVVATAFPYNAANYYQVSMRLLRSGQTYPEIVGDIISLATHSLAANEADSLYDDPVGLRLNDGDSLVGYLVSTGSPVALVAPSFVLDIQSFVR